MSKEGEGGGEDTGDQESTRPEKSIPKVADIKCKGTECNDGLDSIIRKCERLKGCREMLLDAKAPPAAVKAAPAEAVKTVEPKVETVKTTVTVTAAVLAPEKSTSAPVAEPVSTTEAKPDVIVTKTVSVPVYKTLREDADTETIYRTITKKARHPPTKTTSRLCDEPARKYKGLALRCKSNMTDCRSSGGQDSSSGGGSGGSKRTIVNTIYSIQKS